MPRVEVAAGADGAELLEVIQQAGFAKSRSEGRRLVAQGGVRSTREGRGRWPQELSRGEYLLQVGKRRFARIRVRG